MAGSTGEPSSQGKVLGHIVKVGLTYLKGDIYFNPERSKESERKKEYLQNLKDDSTNVEKDPKWVPSMKTIRMWVPKQE